jgi:O-antigen/teichoic acid export membrane protein
VLASAWSAIAALIVSYGFQVKVLRTMSAEPEKALAILRSDLLAMSVLLIPGCIVASGIAYFMIIPEDWLIFAIIFLATINSVVGDYISCALRGLNSFAVEAKISVISCAVQFAVVVGVGVLTGSVFFIAIALCFSRVVFSTLSIAVIFSNPLVSQSTERQATTVTITLTKSWPYFIDAALSVSLSQVDIIMLNLMADKTTIGIYAAGSRLVQLLLVVPWVVTNVMVPAIAGARDADARASEFRKLAIAMIVISVGGLLILLLVAPLFTAYILGPAFAPLNALWVPFAALLLARFYEAYYGIIMTALGRMVERVIVQIMALVAIGGGSVVLVPYLSTTGLICVIGLSATVTGLFYAMRLSIGGSNISRPALTVAATLLLSIVTIISVRAGI